MPIVPVVSIGGQETAIFLSRGETLARLLRLDKMFRLKVLPISIAPPWGLNIGDMAGHIPLPAKITIEVLPPIDLYRGVRARARPRRRLRPPPAPDAGDPRRAGHRARLPLHRMRVGLQHRDRRQPMRARLATGAADPGRYLHFMDGITRWEVQGEQRVGLGSRYRMLMRVRSAEIGGLIEVVEFKEPRRPRLGLGHRYRPARPLAPAQGQRHAHGGVEFRLAYGVAGSGILGLVAERIGASTVRDNIRRSLRQLKRQVEHEQLRAAAAERRRSRMGAA